MSSSTKSPTSARPLVLVLIAAAAGLGYFVDSTGRDIVQQKALLSKYLQNHQCVVAEISRRVASSYRCDAPKPGTYVSAAQAWNEALKADSK